MSTRTNERHTTEEFDLAYSYVKNPANRKQVIKFADDLESRSDWKRTWFSARCLISRIHHLVHDRAVEEMTEASEDFFEGTTEAMLIWAQSRGVNYNRNKYKLTLNKKDATQVFANYAAQNTLTKHANYQLIKVNRESIILTIMAGLTAEEAFASYI